MPLNGSGVYTPPAADFPAVANTLIESTKFNNIVNDIATAISTTVLKDGQQTITSNIPMNGNRITGLGAATASTDAARYDQVSSLAQTNFLLNPGFNVAQRGTSFTSATVPANSDDNYLFDQWILLSDGNDIVDVSRVAQGDAGVNTNASFGLVSDIETINKKFAWIQILSHEKTKALWKNATGKVSAAVSIDVSDTGSFANMRMYVLAWTGAADTVTSDIISAWGAGATEPTLIASLTNESNTSITPSTTLTRFEAADISLDTAGTNNLIFVILNNDDATTLTHTMTLSAPKLEPGPVCTVYQERPYSEELEDCYYYLWRQTRTQTNDAIGIGVSVDSVTSSPVIAFPRPMRSAPAFSISNVGDLTVQAAAVIIDSTNVTVAFTNTFNSKLSVTVAAGLTAGDCNAILFDATAGGFIQFSAEL